jgi:hypothetical protein
MANQKYTGMKTCAYCWVTGANGDTINYTPATTATQFSNGDYPIAVTLGANPNYSVVSTNGIFA